jgi:hypothetical protein
LNCSSDLLCKNFNLFLPALHICTGMMPLHMSCCAIFSYQTFKTWLNLQSNVRSASSAQARYKLILLFPDLARLNIVPTCPLPRVSICRFSRHGGVKCISGLDL